MTDINSSTQTQRAERREPPPPPPPADVKPAGQQPTVEAQQKARDDDNAAAVARLEQARPAAKEIAAAQPSQFRSQPAMPGVNEARRAQRPARPQQPAQQPAAQQRAQQPLDTKTAAQRALQETKPVAANDPHKQHIDAVRSQLDKAGLPSSAPDVRVVINDMGDHGRAVTRAAVGDVGPGRGAETHLQEGRMDPKAQDALKHDKATTDRLASIDRTGRGLERGQASLDQLGQMGTNILEATVHRHRAELGRVRELAQKENAKDKSGAVKPTVANMSWGASVQEVALGNPMQPGLGAAAVNAPKGSPLHKELTKELGHAPTHRDIPAVSKMIAERMQKNIDDKERGQGLREAKEKLGSELQEAADKDKVHVVTAMGNQHEHATHGLGNETWGSSIIHDVPNHTSVGASDLGKDPTKVGDERISTFSSAGQSEIAAPGVQSPVGTPAQRGGAPAKWDGTSFSAPYVAGTIALMLQANPNLTSQQIRETLQGTARDIAGTKRDGAGVVDPVAAVRRARELAPAR